MQQVTEFMEKVEPFMNKGDRFTSKDGDELKARIEVLEKLIEVNEE